MFGEAAQRVRGGAVVEHKGGGAGFDVDVRAD